jgi:hypothetical protein
LASPRFYLLALTAGFASDVLFVAMTRLWLQWATKWDQFGRIFALLSANFLFGLVLVLVPFILGSRRAHGVSNEVNLSDVAVAAAMSNLVDALVSSLFIFLAIFLLVHRLIWPLFEVPLYALLRTGIIGRRKLLLSCGFALIALSTGLHLEWVKKLLESAIGWPRVPGNQIPDGFPVRSDD